MSSEPQNPSPKTPADVDCDAPPMARMVRCAEIGCPNTMGPDNPELPRFCPDHNDLNP